MTKHTACQSQHPRYLAISDKALLLLRAVDSRALKSRPRQTRTLQTSGPPSNHKDSCGAEGWSMAAGLWRHAEDLCCFQPQFCMLHGIRIASTGAITVVQPVFQGVRLLDMSKGSGLSKPRTLNRLDDCRVQRCVPEDPVPCKVLGGRKTRPVVPS